MIVPAVSVRPHPGAPADIVGDALRRTRQLLAILDPTNDRTRETHRILSSKSQEDRIIQDPKWLSVGIHGGLQADIQDRGLSLDITVTMDGGSHLFLRTISFLTSEDPVVDRRRCHEAVGYSIAIMEAHLAGTAGSGIDDVQHRLHGIACHSLHAFQGEESAVFAGNHWQTPWGVVRHVEKNSDQIDSSAFEGIGHAVTIDAYRISAPDDDHMASPAVRIEGYGVGVDLKDDPVEIMRGIVEYQRNRIQVEHPDVTP
jgi:hypothetical protein